MEEKLYNTRQLWERTLVDIEHSTSKANFTTWFSGTDIEKIEDGVVHVRVPNAFVRDWLSAKYHQTLLKTLRAISPSIRSLTYNVSSRPVKRPSLLEPQKEDKGELPLTNYIHKSSNLNPRYVFDTFIVGPFNELAFAASQAVIKNPGSSYNPLFIYGNTGHGKTHLIQSIGNELRKKDQNTKVLYITSESFVLDYVKSVQNNRPNEFKERYRKYDVLIMDDIQFLSGKEKTQEELFHLFNTLYDNNKQIVFSSDKHPNFIPNLEDRLKSRFGAGMIVDISAPDHESRVAILRKKAELLGFDVSEEIIDHIAKTVSGNIRELEGALNSVMCQAEIKSRPITVSDVKNIIKASTHSKQARSPKEIVKIVSDFYNVEENSIYEKTRKKEVIRPRQVIMYILRQDFSISYPSIGQKLGGRDHTTVIHSCEKIKQEIQEDSTLAQEIEEIRSMVTNM